MGTEDFGGVDWVTYPVSRGRLKAGDIFAMERSDGRFFFGRVLYDQVRPAADDRPGLLIVEVAQHSSSEADDLPDSWAQQLLGPLRMQKGGLREGLYRVVGRADLTDVPPLEEFFFVGFGGARISDGNGVSHKSLPEGAVEHDYDIYTPPGILTVLTRRLRELDEAGG